MTKLIELFWMAYHALLSPESLTEFVLFGTVLLLTTSSAYISRRSGVFNLALDGTVVTSALCAYLFAGITARTVGHAGIASIAAGAVGGVLGGLLFTLLVDWLIMISGANSVLVGILANFGARSFSGFMTVLCAGLLSGAEVTILPGLSLKAFSVIPILGGMMDSASIMTWVAVLLPLGAFFMMNRTGLGLCLRAAQENPAALQTAGVSLLAIRRRGMLLSGFVASLAGIACAMGAVPARSAATLPQGFGYLALVIVFAAGGRLGKSIGFAVIFGVLGALPTVFSQLPLPQTLVSSLVYLAALILMLLHVYRRHHRDRRSVRAQEKTREQRKRAKAK